VGKQPDRIGSVEPGKLADLIAYPIADITEPERVRFVMKTDKLSGMILPRTEAQTPGNKMEELL
jgi:hypothetical protein